MKQQKASCCEDCKSFHWTTSCGYCDKGFTIKFYKPKGPTDVNYGYKRKCDYFKIKESDDE